MTELSAFRGRIVFMVDDPDPDRPEEALRDYPDGLLIVASGRVQSVGPYDDLIETLPSTCVLKDFTGQLILPGFVDTHIHYPQIDIIGAYGKQLIDWLDRYTFPAELAFSNLAHCREVAKTFINEILRNGTTSALVFPTVHEISVEALFDEALSRNLRLVSGKVLMDRMAPEALLDGDDYGIAESRRLIEKYHAKGRLTYAVIPRFALSSTSAQLDAAGQLLAENPDLLMTTHLSENLDEIDAVAGLFPDAKDYLDVYDQSQLVTNRSIFAHGVHLSDREFSRLAEAGAALSFCPHSNMFLGSGLFDLARADHNKVGLCLGTDVGAGTCFSMLSTMGDAYKIAQLNGQTLHPIKAFYMATLGGARALQQGENIGHLSPGAEADFIVVDPAATPLSKRRLKGVTRISDLLFTLSIIGDERQIKRTYLQGVCAYKQKK